MIKVSFLTSVYRAEKYLHGFFKSYLNADAQELELILVHNDPTEKELKITGEYLPRIKNVKHIIVPREGVYASWNRAVTYSTAPYLAMWNVDDVRTPEGILSQIDLLDKNAGTDIVTGDYYKVFAYGDLKGWLKKDPVIKGKLNTVYKFNNGCFLMWRKSVHDRIGYFDEQFKVAGDWDFWMRASDGGNPLRSEAVLGYYLRENNTGLSKKSGRITTLENYIVRARYYNFFLANVYVRLGSGLNNVKLKMYLHEGKYLPLNTTRSVPYISELFSFFFFWIDPLLRFLIQRRYNLIQRDLEKKTSLF